MQIVTIILGIFCILYFLCIAFFVGHGTNFYVIWLIGGVILLGIGICMRKNIADKIPSWFKISAWILIAISFAFFIIVQGFIISGFGQKAPENLDYIIVLGAQMKTSGPSRVLQMRLDKAYTYLDENPSTKVIVSGGQGKDEPVSEAKGMFDYLVKKGIEKERIIQEDQSENTFQNLVYSSNYLEKEKASVGIVTNNFHVFRGMSIAKKAGYQEVYGIPAKSEPFLQFNNMLREFLGVVKDVLVGNI